MPRKSIDWQAIEQAWRETRTTCAALARIHGVHFSTIKDHMSKRGIVRNAPEALPTANALPAPTTTPEVTSEELEALKRRVIGQHRAHIELDHQRLNLIAQRLDAHAALSNTQRLTALATIVKVREALIRMERQAHSIPDAAPPAAPATAVQINVNLSPQDAYLQMIGKK